MFRLSIPLCRNLCINYIPIRRGGQEMRIERGIRKTGQEGPLWEGPDWSHADGTPGPLSKGQLRRETAARDMIEQAHVLIDELTESKRILVENPDLGKPTEEDITKYY